MLHVYLCVIKRNVAQMLIATLLQRVFATLFTNTYQQETFSLFSPSSQYTKRNTESQYELCNLSLFVCANVCLRTLRITKVDYGYAKRHCGVRPCEQSVRVSSMHWEGSDSEGSTLKFTTTTQLKGAQCGGRGTTLIPPPKKILEL